MNGERVATRFLELYDCKSISDHFRNQGGEREVPRTSTSVLFGATFNIACFQGQTLKAGLARRFLYYIAERHGRLIVRPPRKDYLGLQALAEGFRDLEKLEKIGGPMDFSQRAALRWEQYQRENRAEMDQTDSLHQEAKLSRLSSAPTQTLSIAMIFANRKLLSFDQVVIQISHPQISQITQIKKTAQQSFKILANQNPKS